MPPRCFALRSLLMPALLPAGDESAMNLEAVGVLFRHYFYFPQHLSEVGVNFAENVARSSCPK